MYQKKPVEPNKISEIPINYWMFSEKNISNHIKPTCSNTSSLLDTHSNKAGTDIPVYPFKDLKNIREAIAVIQMIGKAATIATQTIFLEERKSIIKVIRMENDTVNGPNMSEY